MHDDDDEQIEVVDVESIDIEEEDRATASRVGLEGQGRPSPATPPPPSPITLRWYIQTYVISENNNSGNNNPSRDLSSIYPGNLGMNQQESESGSPGSGSSGGGLPLRYSIRTPQLNPWQHWSTISEEASSDMSSDSQAQNSNS